MVGRKNALANPESQGVLGIPFSELMKAVLEKNIPLRFTSFGLSMSPFIRDGDVITIAPVLPYCLRIGDVVAFVNPGDTKLKVHRILLVSKEGFLIKGDNNLDQDGFITAGSIIGRVVRVQHNGRRVLLGLGFERIVIAWLSRIGLLTPNIWKVWRAIKPFAARSSIKKKPQFYDTAYKN